MTDENIFGKSPVLWAWCIIGVTTLARLWFIASGQLDLVQDEAQYWSWTTHPLQWSYYSKGPLIAYIIAFWCKIWGNTELGVRFGALMNSLFAQLIIWYGVGYLWKRKRLAVFALVVAASTPLFLASGVIMNPDGPMMVCWVASIFAIDAAGRGKGGSLPYWVLGAAIAIGTLSKYMMLGFVPTALIYGYVLHRRGELAARFWPRLCAAIIGGTVLGMLPIILWNIQNDWVGFKHVTHLTGVQGERAQRFIRFDRFPDYFGAQLGLVTPWWLFFMLLGGVQIVRRQFGKGRGLGLALDRELLLAAAFWPVWGGIFLWSFHTKILGNWPGMSYVGGLIIAAAAFERFCREGSGFWHKIRGVWPSVGAVLFAVMIFQLLIPIPPQYDLALRLKGWQGLGQKIEASRLEYFKDPEKVFVFADSYDMTAELSFYVPGRPMVYCVNGGRRMNQYDLWSGPQDKVGWDAIYVRKRFKEGPESVVNKMFDRIEYFHFQSEHMGAPGRKFTIFLCYGYNGYWPENDGTEF